MEPLELERDDESDPNINGEDVLLSSHFLLDRDEKEAFNTPEATFTFAG